MAELLNLQTLIILLAAVASFGAIVAFTLPYLQTDQRAARREAVTKRREELSEQQRALYQQKSARNLRSAQVSNWKRIIGALRLQNMVDSKMVRQRMVQAGHRGQVPVMVFAVAHIVAPLALMVFSALFVFGPGGSDMAIATKILSILGAGVVGFLMPSVIVSNMITKRQLGLMRAMPDALDLLVICVESGSSLEAAFNRVADELDEISTDLAEEFGITVAELAFLSDRREALDKLAQRTGLAAIKSLTTSLIQAEKYGTPLAGALRVLAQENRDARMSAAEKKAGALPAMLTVPMIVFFLPVLFIVLLGPAVITAMKKF
jgi:tight adherence protein C